MLTNYIGNITFVEPGQIIVVVGKTTDAATRYIPSIILILFDTNTLHLCTVIATIQIGFEL